MEAKNLTLSDLERVTGGELDSSNASRISTAITRISTRNRKLISGHTGITSRKFVTAPPDYEVSNSDT